VIEQPTTSVPTPVSVTLVPACTRVLFAEILASGACTVTGGKVNVLLPTALLHERPYLTSPLVTEGVTELSVPFNLPPFVENPSVFGSSVQETASLHTQVSSTFSPVLMSDLFTFNT